MGNRGAAERQAIEQSHVDGEKKKDRPKRGRRSLAELYSSWGADDALLFFRFSGAAVGFRAQAMAPPAIALGRKPTPFWDEGEYRRMRERRTIPVGGLADIAKLTDRLYPNLDAMPTHSRQARTFTRADRMTDAQLDSVRSLRRIAAGMLRVRSHPQGLDYRILELAFVPGRTELKLELEFPQLFGIVLSDVSPLRDAWAKDEKKDVATKDAGGPAFAAWVIKRIERREALRGLSITDGTKETDAPLQEAWNWALDRALSSLAVYEANADEPPEVVQERERKEREASEKAEARTRKPREPIVDAFAPDGWGR